MIKLWQTLTARWRRHQQLTARQLAVDICLVIAVAGALRFYQVGELPRGLNWDEVAYGYNAWALRTTGLDEWSEPWPLFLRSFGEYKPALLSYYLMPWLGLTGDWSWDIRLAAATLGVASCIGTYMLVLRTSRQRSLALLSAIFLALTPWHLHYSRTVMDPIISFTLLVWGWWAWFDRRRLVQIAGAALLVGSMWSYNSARLLVPLLALVWFSQQWRSDTKLSHWLRSYTAPLALLIAGSIWIWSETLWGVGGSRARLMADIQRGEIRQQSGVSTELEFWLAYGQATATRYLAHFNPTWLYAPKPDTMQSGLGFSKHGYLLWFMAPLASIGLLQLYWCQPKELRRSHWWWLAVGCTTRKTTKAGRSSW